MGWITPAELDGDNLMPGTTVTVSTPALTRSASHGVRIVPTWWGCYRGALPPSYSAVVSRLHCPRFIPTLVTV
jgi:hypothetical protein